MPTEIDTMDIVEQVEETTRKLASIQRIVDIKPIQGADRIEVAQVLGWQCVIAKKDNFKVGDLVVYLEVDSQLPPRPEFEFLRERKFRIKTIKLKKQISEGLIMPLSILPRYIAEEGADSNNHLDAQGLKPIEYKEGDDVTKDMGVTKHDPEGKVEQALVENEKRSPLMRFAMGIPAFRWVYLKLNEKKGPWPSWIERTDETRIQVCAKYMMEHYDKEWEITEKLDGQSATFFVHPMKVWGIKRNMFGVCSRKIWLKTPTDSKYWQTAKKFDLEKALRNEKNAFCPINDIFVQGEQCGPGIQANKYKLSDLGVYIFNLVVHGHKMSYQHIVDFCNNNGLKPVPLINGSFIPKKEIGENKSVMEVVNFMIALSQGNSALLDRPREGIVCRLKSNPNVSLKVINPLFKMEQEAEEDKNEQE